MMRRSVDISPDEVEEYCEESLEAGSGVPNSSNILDAIRKVLPVQPSPRI